MLPLSPLSDTPSSPPWRPDLAFVVQLAAAGADPEQLTGRAEHIASGTTTRFHTLTELFDFLGRVAQQAQPASSG